MSKSIAQLMSELRPDAWRQSVPFSQDIRTAQERILNSAPDDCSKVLNEWLSTNNQPCLFGRAGAKLGLISYCILTESELSGSDESIEAKIQKARTEWHRQGYEGGRSGFVILAVSEKIAIATPDDTVKALAKRLCELYLVGENIRENCVLLEDLFLEMPGKRQTTWKWQAGVNYFCAQGDGRWWHDHRIPGGMAFSVNSVGHMVKSAKLAAKMKEVEQALDAPSEGWDASKFDSLEKALAFAMRTITNAADTVSGKATQLLPLPQNRNEMPVPTCPFNIPADLADKNFCEYEGRYHTDYTIPSEYFLPDVQRPTGLTPHTLDFTYLFHKHVDNPAHRTMGQGQQIRADHRTTPADHRASEAEKRIKQMKSNEEIVPIDACPKLRKALRQ